MPSDLGRHARSLADALGVRPDAPLDAAGVELARTYAAALDVDEGNPEVLAVLGPKYLAVLTSLGLVPAGRVQVKGGGTVVPSSKRDELKDRRSARQNRAAFGDTSA